jgi:hypothetical protein
MLSENQTPNISTPADCGIEYFMNHLAEIEVRALRSVRDVVPIAVRGLSPRHVFTAGFFPAFDKAWRAVDKSLSERPGCFPEHFGMEMAACFMNLNCDHPRLIAEQPWSVCSGKEGVFIQSGNGIRLARTASGGGWDLSHADRALQMQPSNLAVQVMTSINYALDGEIAFPRPSLLFPNLSDNPAVQWAAWGIFIGTVFSPTSRRGDGYGRRSDENRYLFIDRLHEARHDANAREDVIASLAVLPQIMFLRGWCGGTLLHDSCEYSITRLVEWILDFGSNDVSFQLKGKRQTRDKLLTAQDNDGFTPLHRAALSKDQHLFERLLSAGSNPHIEDRYGMIALSYLE